MTLSPISAVIPLGSSFRARSAADRVAEGVPRDIPLVDQLANALQRLANGLPDEARQSLFTDLHQDRELRVLQLSKGIEHVNSARHAPPDKDWLLGAGQARAGSFQTADFHEDAWLAPEPRG